MELKLVIMEQLLVENRIQQVLNKFTSRRGKNLVNKVSYADPSGNNKYLAWVVHRLTKYNDQSEYLLSNNYSAKNTTFNKIMENVKFFHERQSSFEEKDINQYKTMSDLSIAVDVVKIKVQEKELIKIAKSGSVKVYEDENIFVVMPKNHKSSCYYGQGTRWCTSMKDHPSYFSNYTSKGFLFYFIVKKPIKGDEHSYKSAMLLGIDDDLISLLEDEDDFEYYAEDFDGDSNGLESFLRENGCSGEDCILEEAFDAPDNVYDEFYDVMHSPNWENNEPVTNSHRLAYNQIINTYKPKLLEFSRELHNIAKKSFISFHKMGIDSGQMETLTGILRDAGVTDFGNLSFSDATSIINDYIKDNTFDVKDLYDLDTDLDSRFPLADR